MPSNINQNRKLVFDAPAPIMKNHFVMPVDVMKFAEDGKVPTEIHILPFGEWDHPAYGNIVIGQREADMFVENFNAKIRNDIPVTEGHDFMDESPAVGWFKELNIRDNGVWASIEWTTKGSTLLKNREYKYFSPEFYTVYEDPQTGEKYMNVLVGGALTNKPYFKELEAVVLSEHHIKKLSEIKMNLKDILAKAIGDLTDAEKAFLRDNATELDETQKVTYKAILDEEDEADADADAAADADADAEADPVAPVDADAKVEITASELHTLRNKANAGYRAEEKMLASEIKGAVQLLTFSSSNADGVLLAKMSERAETFMLGLTAPQRKEFAEIVGSVPARMSFGEMGGAGDAPQTDLMARLETAIEKKMSEDKALTYASAMSKVFAENADMAKEYNKAYMV